MEKRILYTLIIITIFSTTLKSQWTVYQTNTTMQLNKIQFINENTGFAAGGSEFYNDSAVFFRTTNSGMSWTKFIVYDSTVPRITNVYGLFFVNANTGFLSGRSLDVYKTTNGGLKWQPIRLPYYSLTQIYNALYFVNENTGYAAGRYGYVCKTTNGGINWELKADLEGNLHGVYFINQNTGFFSSASGGVYKTTNGGQNFSYHYLGEFGFESVRFINDTIGFICGRDVFFHSAVFKTTNCGITWENIFEGNYMLYDVFFVNQNSGFLSGQDIIFKTTTSGINWYSLSNPENNGFLSIFFTTTDYGFISGGTGKIYKTTSGGVWINQISSEVPDGFKISNCYPNPFNSELKVQIELNTGLINNPEIILEVYNTLGKLILSKNINLQFPGKYEMGIRFDEYPSGIYFVRLRSQDVVTNSKKIILLK